MKNLSRDQLSTALHCCSKNQKENTCQYCHTCPMFSEGSPETDDCKAYVMQEASELLVGDNKSKEPVRVRGSFIKGENYCQCGFQLMGRPDFQPKFCHQCGRRLNWYDVTDYEEGKTWWEDKWEKERQADILSIKNHHLALDKLALLDEIRELKEKTTSILSLIQETCQTMQLGLASTEYNKGYKEALTNIETYCEQLKTGDRQ